MKLRETEIPARSLDPARYRSPGLHLSSVLKPLLQSVDSKRFAGGEIDLNRTLMGYIWEEVLAQAFARVIREANPTLKQVELESEMNGRMMTFTLDAFDSERWRVHEYKATWMSSRHPITDHRFWHWFVQLRAYCRVASTREAELWVLFVNGDYSREKGKGGPVMKRWVVEFSEQEIAENWKMLENKLRDLIRRGEL